MDPSVYFDNLEEPLNTIALRLRKIVQAHSNSLKEELKWNVPTYSINNKNVCSIMAHKKHVNLQLFQGAHIKDSKLLEGNGKDMRHLKFARLDDINKADISKLLSQAVALC